MSCFVEDGAADLVERLPVCRDERGDLGIGEDPVHVVGTQDQAVACADLHLVDINRHVGLAGDGPGHDVAEWMRACGFRVDEPCSTCSATTE